MNTPYRDFPRIPDPLTLQTCLRVQALDRELEHLRLARLACAHSTPARTHVAEPVRRLWQAIRGVVGAPIKPVLPTPDAR
jgi:hypothetical protein